MKRFLSAFCLFVLSLSARADGTLTHLSGPVSLLKADGKTVPGTAGAKAVTGDTVITGANAYVRMEMSDGGEMVLRPDSQLKIEAYQYKPEKPAEDSSVFSMLKGGLRTVTGMIGKRGNKDAYEMRSATATIGIRGTQYDMRVCAGNCGALADGTYLAVRFGAVQASNPQGSLPVAAGQVAHVPPKLPPAILPRDPGIGFTPPAAIPKLDEKKKIQASQAAAPAPEQPKPAAAQPAPAAQGGQASSPPAQSGSQPEAKQEAPAAGQAAAPAAQGTPQAAPTQPQTTPAAPATANPLQGLSSPAAAPASTPQPAGVECSIQ